MCVCCDGLEGKDQTTVVGLSEPPFFGVFHIGIGIVSLVRTTDGAWLWIWLWLWLLANSSNPVESGVWSVGLFCSLFFVVFGWRRYVCVAVMSLNKIAFNFFFFFFFI